MLYYVTLSLLYYVTLSLLYYVTLSLLYYVTLSLACRELVERSKGEGRVRLHAIVMVPFVLRQAQDGSGQASAYHDNRILQLISFFNRLSFLLQRGRTRT
jgi:hypothetical protein